VGWSKKESDEEDKNGKRLNIFKARMKQGL